MQLQAIAAQRTDLVIDHFSWDSPQARALEPVIGKKTGTAKQVAHAAGIPVDWDAVYEEIGRQKERAGTDARPAQYWSPRLDDLLNPCREQAAKSGYFMTPILIVDNRVCHFGNVISPEEIAACIDRTSPE